MASYRVLSPLLHDGKKYEPGEIVELNEEEAARAMTATLVLVPPVPTSAHTVVTPIPSIVTPAVPPVVTSETSAKKTTKS